MSTCRPIDLTKGFGGIRNLSLGIFIKGIETPIRPHKFFIFVMGPEGLDRYIMCLFQAFNTPVGHSTQHMSIQLLLS